MTLHGHDVASPRAADETSPGDWYAGSPAPSEPSFLSRQLSNASSYGPLTPGSEKSVPSYVMSPTLGEGSIDWESLSSHSSWIQDNRLSVTSTGHDEAEASVDWTRYDYVADEDSGYWRLQSQYIPTANMPETIRHTGPTALSHRGDSSAGSSQRQSHETSSSETRRWVCLMADCNAGAFKRLADLQRHYAQVHSVSSIKESYVCDYPRCSRRREPFGRRDHFRDHLRDFHCEDICKRGSAIDKNWLQSRIMYDHWWRCSKCLVRVRIEESDYTCSQCRSTCEDSRQKERRHRFDKPKRPSQSQSSGRGSRR